MEAAKAEVRLSRNEAPQARSAGPEEDAAPPCWRAAALSPATIPRFGGDTLLVGYSSGTPMPPMIAPVASRAIVRQPKRTAGERGHFPTTRTQVLEDLALDPVELHQVHPRRRDVRLRREHQGVVVHVRQHDPRGQPVRQVLHVRPGAQVRLHAAGELADVREGVVGDAERGEDAAVGEAAQVPDRRPAQRERMSRNSVRRWTVAPPPQVPR